MKSEQTIEGGSVRTTVMGLARRPVMPVLLAIAAIGLALSTSPATAAQEHKFKVAVDPDSWIYSVYHGGYNVFNVTGTGTVVGDFSAEDAIHFRHGFTAGDGWWTITASNGDLLYVLFEQTGSFESGYWEGPYTIVGGTGRFANATGAGWSVTTSNVATWPVSATLDGTISF